MSAALTAAGAAEASALRDREVIALVGLSGAGKTAVMRELARRAGGGGVDVDDRIAAAAGRPAAAVIDTDGEPRFRELERDAVLAALDDPDTRVLACGAGALGDARTRHALLERAVVVWLDAPDDVLLARLGAARDRPLLRGDPAARLRALRAERTPHYGEAHVRVDASGDPATVAQRVLTAVRAAARREPAPDTTVIVPVGERAYPVRIRAGVLDELPQHLPEGCARVAVVTDRAVLRLGSTIARGLRAHGVHARVIGVSGGERLKTWSHAGALVRRLSELRLGRGDGVVAVGGGTVGDLAGFAASVYLRGVAIVHVPTTLLAMVDSAVGGKTGVNLPRGKNLAGTFWQPRAVLCDPAVVRSLSRRSYVAALSEVVKCAMIAGNGIDTLLDERAAELERRELDVVAEAVRRCCAVKAAVVAGDEREAGARAILNYGHTAGHALEAVTGYGEAVVHGEAVAVGMRVAGLLSQRVLGCPARDVAWQDDTLRRFGLGAAPPRVDAERLLERTRGDKKAVGGSARWVLVERRGSAVAGRAVDDALALEAIREVVGG